MKIYLRNYNPYLNMIASIFSRLILQILRVKSRSLIKHTHAHSVKLNPYFFSTMYVVSSIQSPPQRQQIK